MTPNLHVATDADAAPEAIGARVRRLTAEAKALAADHVRQLSAAMGELAVMAAEIGAAGEPYTPGARDMARRLSEELQAKAQTLDAIASRS